MERAAGIQASIHFLHDPENEPEPMFPDIENDDMQEGEVAGYINGVGPKPKKNAGDARKTKQNIGAAP